MQMGPKIVDVMRLKRYSLLRHVSKIYHKRLITDD